MKRQNGQSLVISLKSNAAAQSKVLHLLHLLHNDRNKKSVGWFNLSNIKINQLIFILSKNNTNLGYKHVVKNYRHIKN